MLFRSNDTATTEIYTRRNTLSLHDALPIWDYLDGLMNNVERAATRIANNAGAEVTDSFVEFL